MTDSFSISLDYRNTDDNKHEAEVNYWDSKGHECSSTVQADSAEQCLNDIVIDISNKLLEQTKKETEESSDDLADYVKDLESYVSELEKQVEATLEELDEANKKLKLQSYSPNVINYLTPAINNWDYPWFHKIMCEL